MGACPCGARTHPVGMFVFTEAKAAAIRAAFERRGELSAASSCAGRSEPDRSPRRPAPVPGPLPAGSRYPCRCARGSDRIRVGSASLVSTS